MDTSTLRWVYLRMVHCRTWNRFPHEVIQHAIQVHIYIYICVLCAQINEPCVQVCVCASEYVCVNAWKKGHKEAGSEIWNDFSSDCQHRDWRECAFFIYFFFISVTNLSPTWNHLRACVIRAPYSTYAAWLVGLLRVFAAVSVSFFRANVLAELRSKNYKPRQGGENSPGRRELNF